MILNLLQITKRRSVTRKTREIGNGTPDFIGGITNNFSYKGFDLAVFMKFSVGGDVYNATKHSMSPYALFQNVPSEFGDNYYHIIDLIQDRLQQV